jgi:hypothetical protein
MACEMSGLVQLPVAAAVAALSYLVVVGEIKRMVLKQRILGVPVPDHNSKDSGGSGIYPSRKSSR